MVYDEISLDKKSFPQEFKCHCGKFTWCIESLDIDRMVTGGFVLGFKLNFNLTCNSCGYHHVKAIIGTFDNKMNLLDISPKSQMNIKILNEYNINEQIIKVMKELEKQ